MLTSIGLNMTWDFAFTERDDGLNTITLVCNHQVTSQIVRASLLHNRRGLGYAFENPLSINWEIFLNENISNSLIIPQIRTLINSIQYAQNASLSSTGISDNGQCYFTVGPICYEIDCENQKTCEELCI